MIFKVLISSSMLNFFEVFPSADDGRRIQTEFKILVPTFLSIFRRKYTQLQFISHLFPLWPDHPADKQERIGFLVLN